MTAAGRTWFVDKRHAEVLRLLATEHRVESAQLAGDSVGAGANECGRAGHALRFGATAVEHEGTLLAVPDPRRPVSP